MAICQIFDNPDLTAEQWGQLDSTSAPRGRSCPKAHASCWPDRPTPAGA